MDGSATDITGLRRAQEEIERLNETREQRFADRTAELDVANKELEASAYSASHDLRAPLRHVSEFSSLLAERSADCLDEKGRHDVDVTIRSVNEMGRLIDDLLEFSRTGRVEPIIEPVDTDVVVQEALRPCATRPTTARSTGPSSRSRRPTRTGRSSARSESTCSATRSRTRAAPSRRGSRSEGSSAAGTRTACRPGRPGRRRRPCRSAAGRLPPSPCPPSASRPAPSPVVGALLASCVPVSWSVEGTGARHDDPVNTNRCGRVYGPPEP